MLEVSTPSSTRDAASSLLLRPFTEGAVAFGAGVLFGECPHADGTPHAARWRAGFVAARNVRLGESADIAAELHEDAAADLAARPSLVPDPGPERNPFGPWLDH